MFIWNYLYFITSLCSNFVIYYLDFNFHDKRKWLSWKSQPIYTHNFGLRLTWWHSPAYILLPHENNYIIHYFSSIVFLEIISQGCEVKFTWWSYCQSIAKYSFTNHRKIYESIANTLFFNLRLNRCNLVTWL